jgi:polyisoprenoid-binding protein YceI
MAIRPSISAAGMLLALAAALAACTATYSMQPSQGARTAPGTIEFVASNMIATARGTFHRWSFRRVEIDRQNPERSVVEIEIDVASIDTGIGARDDHLRTADFFEVEKYPTATIRVEEATPDGKTGDGHPRYAARFRVRIRDVEKTLDGHFALVDEAPPRVEGDLVLNRVDFGVGTPYRWWNPASVGPEIPVHFSTPIPVGD